MSEEPVVIQKCAADRWRAGRGRIMVQSFTRESTLELVAAIWPDAEVVDGKLDFSRFLLEPENVQTEMAFDRGIPVRRGR